MTDGGEAAPAPLFEVRDGDLRARCEPGAGSGVLAVVFSQVRVPEGRFGLSRLFARTRHARLLLNQPSGRWYRDAGDAVDAAIARAAAETGAGRVVLYGSSMGAHGAAAAAARRPDADLVAFAPDLRIGEAGSRSAREGLPERPGEPGLDDLLAVSRTGRTDVVCGLFDPYDAGAAARLAAAAPAARVVPVASGHEVHDHLYSANVVRRIIGTFDRDVVASVAERRLLHPPVDAARLLAFAALAAGLGAGRPVDPAAVRDLGLDGNPGAALLEADALAAAGELDAAEARLARLAAEIDASPLLSGLPKRWRKAVPLRRIRWLASLGREREAAAVAATARRDLGDDPRFRSEADGWVSSPYA